MHKLTMGIVSHILQEIKSIMYGHVKPTAKNINKHSKIITPAQSPIAFNRSKLLKL